MTVRSEPPLASAAERLRGRPGRPKKAPPAQSVEALQAKALRSQSLLTRSSTTGVCEVCTESGLAPRLLAELEAARYLGVSRWTLRDLVMSGALPRVRLMLPNGREVRRLLLDMRDLDRFVDVSKEPPLHG